MTASKKELQVLVGHLAHASTVVRGGRTFSRKLLNFIKYLPDSARKVPLPTWFKPDLTWLVNLMSVFNGAAQVIRSQATLEGHVGTDSSMSGFGGVWCGDWFLGAWDSERTQGPHDHLECPPSDYSETMNINILELWPILVSAKRWGTSWSGKKVHVLTDNTQVLHMMNTGCSLSTQCMFWLRELFWLSYVYNFSIVASYINTKDNIVPDFLSSFFDDKRNAVLPVSHTQFLCYFQDTSFTSH